MISFSGNFSLYILILFSKLPLIKTILIVAILYKFLLLSSYYYLIFGNYPDFPHIINYYLLKKSLLIKYNLSMLQNNFDHDII